MVPRKKKTIPAGQKKKKRAKKSPATPKAPKKTKYSTRYKNTQRHKRRLLREERAPGRGVTKDDRRAVFLRYGFKCLKCGSEKRMVLDHVISLYAGGLHDPCNLQVLCWRCNTKKGWEDKTDYRPKPFSDSIHRALVNQIEERRARQEQNAKNFELRRNKPPPPQRDKSNGA